MPAIARDHIEQDTTGRNNMDFDLGASQPCNDAAQRGHNSLFAATVKAGAGPDPTDFRARCCG
jgi:hypothetical protein